MRKIYFVGVLLLLFVSWLLLYPSSSEEKAVLSGQVTWVIETGSKVEQGSELVRIRTLTGGEIAAARAGGYGIVRETFVHTGDKLTKGSPVARIENKAK